MELFVQNQSPSQIAKKLGIKRVEVERHVDEWRQASSGSKFLQERVTDLLSLLDTHYAKLIRDYWTLAEDIDAEIDVAGPKEKASLFGQKNSALGKIADLEAKRIDVLQRAGLLEAADMGDQFAEQEEKQQQVIAILHEVTAHCPRCKIEVANRLAKITGQAPVIVVNNE
mgnify:FL=1